MVRTFSESSIQICLVRFNSVLVRSSWYNCLVYVYWWY